MVLGRPHSVAPRSLSLKPLVFVTAVNYGSLVPYFVHNDASSHHWLPGARAAALVLLALAWFVVGTLAFARRHPWGRVALLSFLVAEAALYVHTFVTGAEIHQLHNPSLLEKTVFVIGYLSGATALVYIVLISSSGGGRNSGRSVTRRRCWHRQDYPAD